MGEGIDDEEDSWTELEDIRPDLAEAQPIRHGMVLGGRYTIEKVLGRGGSCSRRRRCISGKGAPCGAMNGVDPVSNS